MKVYQLSNLLATVDPDADVVVRLSSERGRGNELILEAAKATVVKAYQGGDCEYWIDEQSLEEYALDLEHVVLIEMD